MKRLCGDCKKKEGCKIRKNLMSYAVKATVEFKLTECMRHKRKSTPLWIIVVGTIREGVKKTVKFIKKVVALSCMNLSAKLFNLGMKLSKEEE